MYLSVNYLTFSKSTIPLPTWIPSRSTYLITSNKMTILKLFTQYLHILIAKITNELNPRQKEFFNFHLFFLLVLFLFLQHYVSLFLFMHLVWSYFFSCPIIIDIFLLLLYLVKEFVKLLFLFYFYCDAYFVSSL